LTTCVRSNKSASRVSAIGVILWMFAGGAAFATPDYPGASPTPPASAPAAADAGPDWNSMPQDGLFSSITQNLRESEQEVVRGHFDLGEPPNVRRYYCLVNPKNGRREPNGVAGTPVLRPDGMTGIKIEAVSLYTCAKAEQKGFLVSTGYVLNSPALARAAARSAAAAASAPPAAPGSGAATTPAAVTGAAATGVPAAAPAPAAATPAPVPPVRMAADRIDVAGIKLGSSPDAVRTVLKSKNLRHYKEWTETLSSSSSNGTSQSIPNGRFVNVIAAWTPSASAAAGEDFESDGESFEVMFTPVPGGERAMAIVHTQGFSRQNAIHETALDDGLVKKYGGYVAAGALPESVTWRYQGDGSVQVGDACGRRGTFGGLGGLSVANTPRENLALRRTAQELQSQVERCGDATVTADHFTPNGGALPADRLVTRFTVTAFSPALGLEGARKAAELVQAAGASSEARPKDSKAPNL
jgi:hypothetical protein